ncbi:hypothetical protein PGT21_014103 [Puccinia graminis f. sp. tritici]|uniref:Uncharacterized protein n=1 Tax=Puccinia graminis f. sp. tritici TaxID=56615 RepID=A0A5B0NJB2_PUCGR|nr:hypothetical protein PGT21_014103 [Puccinia graminis f. sp. tritici]
MNPHGSEPRDPGQLLKTAARQLEAPVVKRPCVGSPHYIFQDCFVWTREEAIVIGAGDVGNPSVKSAPSEFRGHSNMLTAPECSSQFFNAPSNVTYRDPFCRTGEPSVSHETSTFCKNRLRCSHYKNTQEQAFQLGFRGAFEDYMVVS